MHPLNFIIENRWSPKGFDNTKLVENEKIVSLFEAARIAPSSFNEQPWYFLAGLNFDKCHALILSTLSSGNQAWATNAPVLLITVAKLNFAKNNEPNFHALHDLGLATENLMLQAVDMKLGVHPMGGFDKEKVKEIFEVPDNFQPAAAIAVGYLTEAEAAKPIRHLRGKISQFVFKDKWGEGVF